MATLDTLMLMPRRVPRRERSGQMLAKAALGRVTRPAEKNPKRRGGQLVSGLEGWALIVARWVEETSRTDERLKGGMKYLRKTEIGCKKTYPIRY